MEWRDARSRVGEENARSSSGRARDVMGQVELSDHRGKELEDQRRSGESPDNLGDAVGHDLLPGEFSIYRQSQSHGWIGVASADRSRGVNGHGHGQSPRDADAPISVLVGAGVVERVHGGDRVAEGDDDEHGDCFGEKRAGELPGHEVLADCTDHGITRPVRWALVWAASALRAGPSTMAAAPGGASPCEPCA